MIFLIIGKVSLLDLYVALNVSGQLILPFNHKARIENMSNGNQEAKPEERAGKIPLERLVMPQKNKLYWSYNLPLQVWARRKDQEDEKSEIVDYRLLNYMPRKESFCELMLSDVKNDQNHEEFFETAATMYDNLAKQCRAIARSEDDGIYYPDSGMEEA